MYRCESWTIGQLSAKELMLFFKLFFYFKFIFQWKIRASQNCVGFYQTSIWISNRYTYVPSLFWIVVLEKTLESPLDCMEIKPVNLKGNQLSIHWKDWCWSWSSNNLATWCEQLTHWKRPWFWERLKAEGEKGIRGWDGWMASPMQWTWTWANFGRSEERRVGKECSG